MIRERERVESEGWELLDPFFSFVVQVCLSPAARAWRRARRLQTKHKRGRGGRRQEERSRMVHVVLEDMPWMIQFLTYTVYLVSMAFSYFQEYTLRIMRRVQKRKTESDIDYENGYAPLCNPNSLFFVRWSYRRVEDLFNRPVSGLPGGYIDVMMRQGDPMEGKPLRLDGTLKRCLNLGSYNYLGFAENDTPITDSVINSVKKYGTSGLSLSPSSSSSSSLHQVFIKSSSSLHFHQVFIFIKSSSSLHQVFIKSSSFDFSRFLTISRVFSQNPNRNARHPQTARKDSRRVYRQGGCHHLQHGIRDKFHHNPFSRWKGRSHHQ